MSKISPKLVILALLAGLILTLVSFLYSHNKQSKIFSKGVCTYSLAKHGLPLEYYQGFDGSKCAASDVASRFNKKNFIIDFVVLSFVGGAAVYAFNFKGVRK